MKNYRKRFANDILKRKPQGKGAVLIEGIKWCAKIATAKLIAERATPGSPTMGLTTRRGAPDSYSEEEFSKELQTALSKCFQTRFDRCETVKDNKIFTFNKKDSGKQKNNNKFDSKIYE